MRHPQLIPFIHSLRQGWTTGRQRARSVSRHSADEQVVCGRRACLVSIMPSKTMTGQPQTDGQTLTCPYIRQQYTKYCEPENYGSSCKVQSVTAGQGVLPHVAHIQLARKAQWRKTLLLRVCPQAGAKGSCFNGCLPKRRGCPLQPHMYYVPHVHFATAPQDSLSSSLPSTAMLASIL